MRHFTQEQLKTARKADLYDYLIRHHACEHRRDGHSLHPIGNNSLSIKVGQTGYKDFNGDETGNSVDYLVRHMGYQLDEAVFALCGDSVSGAAGTSINRSDPPHPALPPVFPERAGQYRQMFAYLMSRAIPQATIQMLIDEGILYQDLHNNCVFVNYERDWAELRGTYTYGAKPFHGMVANCRKDGFWWFRTSSDAKVCYVCEASIDAISLYELHKQQGYQEPAYYIGIGGVAKQDAINRIKKHFKTIIAVDNDAAGDGCRERNPDCETIRPQNKDWNEDLQARDKVCSTEME